MTSYAQVCARWIDVVLGRTHLKPLETQRVFPRSDIIYSYGMHFPMANAIRARRGPNRGQVELFLVNGDNFSVSTTRHQGHVRDAINGSGVPSVILPYSALRAAGLDPDTIELVERTEDQWLTEHHRTYTPPEGSVWRDIPIKEYQRRPEEEIRQMLDRENAERMESWERKHRYAREEQADERGYAKNGLHPNFWTKWVEERSVAEYPCEATEDDLSHHRTHHDVVVRHERRLYRTRAMYSTIDVSTDEVGRTVYEWETRKHLLGESLIRGQIRWMHFIRCKKCRGTGSLPGAPARPRRPMAYDFDNWDEHRAALSDYAEADYQWSQKWQCPDGRGRTVERKRTAYFLSGFDANEPRPSYFFCELPPGARPRTIAEAYDVLKPETVKIAEQMGRDVKRQGDIFAIPLERVDKRTLRKQGATFERSGQLLGTNHVANEVARLADGTLLARGALRHVPGFRRPDHVRCPLGKSWHVILKNTVPVAA